MSRPNKTRKRARRLHALRRGMQRYGLFFSREREKTAIDLIQKNSYDAVYIGKGTGNTTIWDIYYDDVTIRVVYSKKAKSIVTVLPREDKNGSNGNYQKD